MGTNFLKVGSILRIFLFGLWEILVIAGCNMTDLQNVKTNDTTKKVTISSATVGDTFEIYISLPKGYDSNPGLNYDVVYLLDGDNYFNETQKMIYDYVKDNVMKPVILIGIGNFGKRERDYTPTPDKDWEGSGGCDKFCNFLKTELIPYIDSNYRTIPNPENRCLIGHSLGGLCTYYALFLYNDTFGKFLAASPSLWWDEEIIFRYEQDYAASNASLPAILYTSACTGDYTINVDVEAMLDKLKKYSGLTVSSNTFEGEGHLYSWRPSFEKGLPLLFKK
jgi:predicted alpha/beta superfamily hydrolase